ncbi:MAG: response regulator [Pirellula sp.]|nr:response regulator [Pirellula sp.]
MSKILVVDDSGLARRATRMILENAGHEVTDAQDGLAAIERYFLDKPELVLLDVTMRDMDGLEVLKRLRDLDPAVRVVFVTADVQSSTREMADAGGACGFIVKPVSAQPLLSAIAAILPEVGP